MKKIIQISLFFFVIFSIYIFYNKFFSFNNEEIIVNENKSKLNSSELSGDNLVKNLEYKINLYNGNKYLISSKESEILSINNNEKIKMKIVKALIIDKNNQSLIIKSDYADFNSSNYNTNFRNNVLIEYLDNKISSDKLDLALDKNIIRIYDNVKYSGGYGEMISDNISINLITKNIKIYMNNKNNNVEIKY